MRIRISIAVSHSYTQYQFGGNNDMITAGTIELFYIVHGWRKLWVNTTWKCQCSLWGGMFGITAVQYQQKSYNFLETLQPLI